MSNCENAYHFLSGAFGGGSLDWNTLFKLMEDWNLDAGDIIDEAEEFGDTLDINYFYYVAYMLHKDDVKDWIKEILEDADIDFDEDAILNYDPEIYTNYMCTSYDDKYEFWSADNKEELVSQYSSELAEFLIDNDIVDMDEMCEELKEDKCCCEEDEEKCEEEFECEVDDAIEFLSNKIKGVEND